MSMLKKIKPVIIYLISFAIIAQQKDNVHAVEDLNQSKPVTKYPCCSNTTKISCNLSDAMEKLRELENNTLVIITNQYNYLWDQQNFTIHNKSNMTLMGYSNKTDEIPIICCKNSSLTFLSISNLYIKNLVFVGCGSITHNNMLLPPPAALVINDCYHIRLINIIISQSQSIGLAVLNTTGCNVIQDCNFTSNGNEAVSNGGGMLLYARNQTNASYNITRCLFQSNIKKLYGKLSKYYLDLTGHGGGLMVALLNTEWLAVHINDSTFVNNKADNGGGAMIKLYNCEYLNISIHNCTFEHNNAKSTIKSNGGGLQIQHFGYHNNTIKITQSNFSYNEAYFGGGLSVDCGFNYDTVLLIQDCHWIGNNATSGAAVDISRTFLMKPKQFQTIELIFENCTFEQNIVSYSKNTHTHTNLFAVGYGIFTTIGINVRFKSNILFLRNNESALSATLSTIIISTNCSLIFRNNVGTSGGALSLKAARLLLYRNTLVNFTSNHASKYGGALYSVVTDDHMLLTQISCPFTFIYCTPTDENDCNTSIYFNDNKADSAGDSIYLTSLLPCQIGYSSRTQAMINATEVFNLKPFTLSMNDIRTAPSNITSGDMRNIKVYPGEYKRLQLTLKDDLNNTVPSNLTILEATINPESQKLKMKEVYIHNYKYTILGEPKTQAMIRFQTTEKPLLIIRRNVTLKNCPPAYIFNKSSKRCECNESEYYGITKCSDKNDLFKAYIRIGIWCGYQNGQFVTGPCHWFCFIKIPHGEDSSEIKFDSIKNIPDHQDYLCHNNREGVFCSKCKENYTVYYHDNLLYCGPEENCSWGWLIFIASELLPITLVFIVIIMTGFNVTSGYIQGFLLYSHILYSFPSHSRSKRLVFLIYNLFLHIFYYPLNLRFFNFRCTSFCLFPKANTLDIATIKYFQDIYCIFLIFIVAFFLKCFAVYCRGCNRWIRFTTAKNSALIGISALLVLSYTSAIEVSFIILQVSPLYTKGYVIQSQRVALYGDEEYFSHTHMKYAIPACLCLIILIVPALMLLTYPLVLGVLSYFNIDADQSWIGVISTKCYMYTHLKPFYDMFYASFKDKHRYFAGLYFIYRGIIQLAYYIPSEIEGYFVMEALLIAFLIIHATIQPYNKKSHNFIDALLLGNLIIINGITCSNAVIFNMNKREYFWNIVAANYIQVTLSALPMCIAMAYVVWKYIMIRLWRRFRMKKPYQQLLESTSCHLAHHRIAEASDD